MSHARLRQVSGRGTSGSCHGLPETVATGQRLQGRDLLGVRGQRVGRLRRWTRGGEQHGAHFPGVTGVRSASLFPESAKRGLHKVIGVVLYQAQNGSADVDYKQN